ncbi:MAG: ABC transporter ATP-binding protein [Pseudomonadota bacterium]
MPNTKPSLTENMRAGENAIEARNLQKIYQSPGGAPPKHALKGIDLDIPRGAIFGLLGPNGAGKSTFINILAGLVIKTGGEARIWGFDIDKNPRKARASIGVVPQELNIDPFFTPADLLDLHAGLYGVPKAERRTAEILEVLGLTDKADAYARTLSGGMRRRLLVAKAMVHSPPILVLDEPTAGVDVELRQQLWEYVRTLNAHGVTIVLTTHYLEEAEAMCDTIAIINHGQVIACEPTPQLLARISDKRLVVTPAQAVAQLPAGLAGLNAERLRDGKLAISYNPADTPVMMLIECIKDAGIQIADISTEESDLEDVFLQLTAK